MQIRNELRMKTANERSLSRASEARGLLLAQKPYLAAYNSGNFQRLLASGEYLINCER